MNPATDGHDRLVFEHSHTVTFEETTAAGNVYFATYFKWQGAVRELFLAQHAPGVLLDLQDQHALVTVDATCFYLSELWPFDEIIIRLDARDPMQNRLTLLFEFVRVRRDEGGRGEVVARGRQTVAWLTRGSAETMRPLPVPDELIRAIQRVRRHAVLPGPSGTEGQVEGIRSDYRGGLQGQGVSGG